MLTKDVACGLAENWIQAWNAHDLDRIMTHYEDDVELMSPVAVERLGIADGKVKGKADLGANFRKGPEVYPALRFTLIEVLAAGAAQAHRRVCRATEYRALRFPAFSPATVHRDE